MNIHKYTGDKCLDRHYGVLTNRNTIMGPTHITNLVNKKIINLDNSRIQSFISKRERLADKLLNNSLDKSKQHNNSIYNDIYKLSPYFPEYNNSSRNKDNSLSIYTTNSIDRSQEFQDEMIKQQKSAEKIQVRVISVDKRTQGALTRVETRPDTPKIVRNYIALNKKETRNATMYKLPMIKMKNITIADQSSENKSRAMKNVELFQEIKLLQSVYGKMK
jgi:hypothetical protein